MTAGCPRRCAGRGCNLGFVYMVAIRIVNNVSPVLNAVKLFRAGNNPCADNTSGARNGM